MSTIEQIKRQFPIARFVARYTNGLKDSKNGFFVGRCPFHQNETDPPAKRQFWVSPEHGICGCFHPGCVAFSNRSKDPISKPLDIINFYALLENVTVREAIQELAKDAGLDA